MVHLRGRLVQPSALPFGPGEPAAGAGRRRLVCHRFEQVPVFCGGYSPGVGSRIETLYEQQFHA